MTVAIALGIALVGCGSAPSAMVPGTETAAAPASDPTLREIQRRKIWPTPTPSATPTPAPSATPTPTPTATPQPTSTNVLYVSPQGQDANAGTATSPLRTLSAAAAKAKPGMTILVAGGTYYEQVVTRVGGLAGQEITFKSYNGTAVIDGSQLAWTPASNQNQGLFELRHPYVRLDGLKIVNSKNTGVLLAADHLTVAGCEVANAQRHAISTHTSRQTAVGSTMIQDITLDGNLVHDSTLAGSGSGQAISLIADGFVIKGNRVYANKDIGIDVWLGSKHGEVVANTVYNNPNSAGIYVDGASYVRIHRNTIYANKNGIGISSEDTRYSTKRIWVYNNLVYDHTTASGCSIWDPDQGATEVLFAYNTLINNKNSFYLSGSSNSAEIANNLGYSTSAGLYDSSTSSTYRTHNNLWMGSATGFVSASTHDYRLTSASPAINQGVTLSALVDDLGRSYPIDTDFAGTARSLGGAPDLGAYELQ